MHLVHYLTAALKAKELFKRDKDYITERGEIIIVDEFTGRLMHGRRYSDGLHQAIEAKEGVRTRRENQTLASVTFQNYFRLYDKLSGMTGTATTESREFGRDLQARRPRGAHQRPHDPRRHGRRDLPDGG